MVKFRLNLNTFFIFIVFLLVFIPFEMMAPTQLGTGNSGSDGGDYLSAVLTHGVPHPTGYPLYLLLGEIVQNIKSNNEIWKQSQISIIAATFTILIVFILLTNIINRESNLKTVLAGTLASVILAYSPIFWSQSVIIEVYALNALFIAMALLWFCIVFVPILRENKHRDLAIVIVAWFCGLGLANHTTFLLIYPLVFFSLYWLLRNKTKKTILFLSLVGWLSGLALYVILPLRAQLHPLVNWGETETINGFLWMIKGGDYGHNLFAILPSEILTRIAALINIFFKQFSFFGIAAGLIGIFYFNESRFIKFGSIYIFVVYCVFSIGYKTNDSFVYLIPSIMIFTIWIFWGITQVFKLKFEFGVLLSLVLCFSIMVQIPQRYHSIQMNKSDLSEYALQTLSAAPKDSIIYPSTDGQTFTLWFYQYGKGIRPDVKIISKGLLKYAWYKEQLLSTYPNLDSSELQSINLSHTY